MRLEYCNNTAADVHHLELDVHSLNKMDIRFHNIFYVEL